jgi:hypothetical protein
MLLLPPALLLWLLLCGKLGKCRLEPLVAIPFLQELKSDFDLALFVFAERVLLLVDGDGFLIELPHRVYRFAFGDARDFN